METDETTKEPTSSAATATAIGERLREAREAVGLSQEDVASQMRLRLVMVRALEQGRFEEIPGPPPYLRGYLRSYARVVAIDAEPLVQQFDSLGIVEPEPSLRPQVIREPGHRINPYLIGGVVAVVIAVLFGINWIKDGGMFGSGQAEPPQTVEPPAPAEPAGSSVPTVREPTPAHVTEAPVTDASPEAGNGIPAETAAAGAGTDVDDIVALPADEPAAASVPPARDETVSEPAEVPAAASSDVTEPVTSTLAEEDLLVLRFTQDSWVDVRDGTNRRIAYGLMRAGRERRYSELTFPVRFIVGNVVGTEVEFRGERYDLAPHIQTDRTARFTLERP